jgi:SAM-dependent methyltransferase
MRGDIANKCHVCKADSLELFPDFYSLKRAASDCRPWKAGGALGQCTSCGVIQKRIDQSWRDEAAEIYSLYNLYHQSTQGTEQPVFDQTNGNAIPRSQKILNFAISACNFPSAGRMIDIGCGNGAMLRAFSTLSSSWELYGFEPNLTQPDKVYGIKGVKHVFTGQLTDLTEQFDLVTLIHALEHIEDPISFLKQIRQKLNSNGYLLIQVPYFPDNPFDLLIADHCTHFTISTLKEVLTKAGLDIVSIKTDIIDKEISALVKVSEKISTLAINPEQNHWLANHRDMVTSSLHWIQELLTDARKLSKNENFGLFGTAISANWLLGELDQNIGFFVEEDVNRTNRSYHERPVYLPKDTPNEGHVYMVLPRGLAEKINARLDIKHATFHLPPLFENIKEIECL